MYMNAYQQYIADLIDEYGPLLLRQLEVITKAKFKIQGANIKAYIKQMCSFGDFEQESLSDEILIAPKGILPNFDIIRSVEVLISFIPNVISHNKCREHISIRFFVNAGKHNKEICIIPVKQGKERIAEAFASDKFNNEKCEVVIFLLDSKAQMRLINPDCNYKFAMIERQGAVFFKK